MFRIAWQYLSGVAVGGSLSSASRPNWPVDGDRVFQAMVAGWGGGGRKPSGLDALQWLERHFGCPRYMTSHPEREFNRDIPEPVSVFVPGNFGLEVKGGNDPHGSRVALYTRKARNFPTVPVGDAVFALEFDADPPDSVIKALQAIAREVSHIGHSTSMVRVWIEDGDSRASGLKPWLAASKRGEVTLRLPSEGRFDALEERFQLRATSSTTNDGMERWALGLHNRQGVREEPYAKVLVEETSNTGATHFDARIMTLPVVGGARFDLVSTLEVTKALRAKLHDAAGRLACEGADMADLVRVADQIYCGHFDGETHAAFFPLPFVDQHVRHATGGILGVGIALPRCLTEEQRRICTGLVLEAFNGEATLKLVFGREGELLLGRHDPLAPTSIKQSLQAATWVGPSRTWATVTPIVLERHLKGNFANIHERLAAVPRLLALSCEYAGVGAKVVGIVAERFSRFNGAPSMYDMPRCARKCDGERGLQVHAVLEFEREIEGPLLLGNGRFRGYGLCRPLRGWR